jgi:hypothetical protein
MTTTHTNQVPTVADIVSTDGEDHVRITHPDAPPVYLPAEDRAHALRLASAIRGMLAHAYHAGRAYERAMAAIEQERQAVPSTSRRYLVTIRDVGNITDDPRNVHTILTSTDRIAPRDRVEVVAYDDHDCGDQPIPDTGDDETWRQAVARLNSELIERR